MAIKTMNELIAAFPGQYVNFQKASQTSKGAGLYHSLWRVAGLPTAGNVPANITGEICTAATIGAAPFTNAVAGKELFIGRASLTGVTAGALIVYDRLYHNAGMNGTLNTAQTFTQPALTRYTDGLGVEIWLEVYTALGATGVTFTCSYTNELGVAGRTATATATTSASPVAGQMFAATLQQGDRGVRSVQSVTLAATTGTAGNFGVTLVRRLAMIPITVPNVGVVQNSLTLGLPKINDNACIATMVACTATNTGVMQGMFEFITG